MNFGRKRNQRFHKNWINKFVIRYLFCFILWFCLSTLDSKIGYKDYQRSLTASSYHPTPNSWIKVWEDTPSNIVESLVVGFLMAIVIRPFVDR